MLKSESKMVHTYTVKVKQEKGEERKKEKKEKKCKPLFCSLTVGRRN